MTPAQKLCLLLAALMLPISVCAESPQASASSEEGGYAARSAVDGDRGTRWSSAFSDPHWIEVDYGKPKQLVGVKLYWENAHGSAYDVLVSGDGRDWSAVFSTTDGDGGLDDVEFDPVTARFLKVDCRRRGTAWGFSLFEIVAKTAEEPWGEGEPGGFFLRDVDTAVSTNLFFVPAAWKTGSPFAQLTGLGDSVDVHVNGVLATNIAAARKARIPLGSRLRYGQRNTIVVQGSGEAGSILLAGGEAELAEGLRQLRKRDHKAYYRTLAEMEPEGYFPYWLSGRQGFWTVVGVDGDFKESLFCQDGTIEPYKCFSISPFIYRDGRLFTRADAQIDQSLEKGFLPLPAVTWTLEGLTLRVSAFGAGPAGASTTYVRYELGNTETNPVAGKLYLAARPFEVNPPWQWGGFTRIHHAEHTSDWIRVNEYRLVPLTPPTAFGAAAGDAGDITRFLEQGRLPESVSVHDDQGLASAALEYDFELGPGETRAMDLALPLYETSVVAGTFAELAPEVAGAWHDRLGPVRFSVPDREYSDTARASLAYLLLNRDGPAIQPGSRGYEAAWMRDGAVSSATLLRLGFTNEVRAFIDWYATHLFEDGRVPAIVIIGRNEVNPVHEYDSQGQFVYACREYFRFTNDRAFLEQHWPAIVKALWYLARIRKGEAIEARRNDPDQRRYYGILPKCVSHEGYYPEPGNHSYWDNFWALRGWKDGRAIAVELGRDKAAKWMAGEETKLRRALAASLRATMEHYQISYVPGCAELGDFDPSSSSIALTICAEPGVVPSEVWKNTFDRYWGDLERRFQPGWRGSFSPYELRIVPALMTLGRKERALRLLDYLMSCRRPVGWRQWPEALYEPADEGGFIGDMPHTWVASGYLSTLRSLFIEEREEDGVIVLAAGLPAAWVESGQEVAIRNAPTYWGTVNCGMRLQDGRLHVRLSGTARPPGGFIFKSPLPEETGEYRIDMIPAELIIAR